MKKIGLKIVVITFSLFVVAGICIHSGFNATRSIANPVPLMYGLPNTYELPAVDFDLTPPIHGSMPEFTVEWLMELAVLVVRGRAIDRTEAFTVENTITGARTVFTDYSFEVFEVLRGTVDSGHVTVRIESGATNEMRHHVVYVPDFSQNGEYLLFLTIPTGGRFDTPGHYYYIIGGPQGVFRATPNARNRLTRDLSDDSYMDAAVFWRHGRHTNVELRELRANFEVVNATVPIPTASDIINRGIEALRWNVASGVLYMTEDELDEEIAEILRDFYVNPHPARIVEQHSR